jgi:hypothetical protein
MFLCAYCKGALCKYYISVDSKSKYCSKYIKHSLKYNVEGPSVSDWASLEHAKDKVSCKLIQTTLELYKLLLQQSCLIKQQGFFKTCTKEILCCSLDSIDNLEAQEKKEIKQREEDEVVYIAIQFSATAAVPNDPSGLSSEELLVFEFSFWRLIAGSNKIPPVSQSN